MRTWHLVPLLVAAIVLSAIAGGTTAFTTSANVVTAIGLAGFLIVLAVRWRRPVRLGGGGSRVRWWPWVVVVLVVIGVELFDYLSPGTRAAHPTLSSMADAVDRTWGLKSAMFFLWLWCGWALARGRPQTSPETGQR